MGFMAATQRRAERAQRRAAPKRARIPSGDRPAYFDGRGAPSHSEVLAEVDATHGDLHHSPTYPEAPVFARDLLKDRLRFRADRRSES